jgi:hypothetical protein
LSKVETEAGVELDAKDAGSPGQIFSTSRNFGGYRLPPERIFKKSLARVDVRKFRA